MLIPSDKLFRWAEWNHFYSEVVFPPTCLGQTQLGLFIESAVMSISKVLEFILFKAPPVVLHFSKLDLHGAAYVLIRFLLTGIRFFHCLREGRSLLKSWDSSFVFVKPVLIMAFLVTQVACNSGIQISLSDAPFSLWYRRRRVLTGYLSALEQCP